MKSMILSLKYDEKNLIVNWISTDGMVKTPLNEMPKFEADIVNIMMTTMVQLRTLGDANKQHVTRYINEKLVVDRKPVIQLKPE